MRKSDFSEKAPTKLVEAKEEADKTELKAMTLYEPPKHGGGIYQIKHSKCCAMMPEIQHVRAISDCQRR